MRSIGVTAWKRESTVTWGEFPRYLTFAARIKSNFQSDVLQKSWPRGMRNLGIEPPCIPRGLTFSA